MKHSRLYVPVVNKPLWLACHSGDRVLFFKLVGEFLIQNCGLVCSLGLAPTDLVLSFSDQFITFHLIMAWTLFAVLSL